MGEGNNRSRFVARDLSSLSNSGGIYLNERRDLFLCALLPCPSLTQLGFSEVQCLADSVLDLCDFDTRALSSRRLATALAAEELRHRSRPLICW